MLYRLPIASIICLPWSGAPCATSRWQGPNGSGRPRCRGTRSRPAVEMLEQLAELVSNTEDDAVCIDLPKECGLAEEDANRRRQRPEARVLVVDDFCLRDHELVHVEFAEGDSTDGGGVVGLRCAKRLLHQRLAVQQSIFAVQDGRIISRANVVVNAEQEVAGCDRYLYNPRRQGGRIPAGRRCASGERKRPTPRAPTPWE